MKISICPQRVISEALDLLLMIEPKTDEEEERIGHNISELEGLSRSLARDGITKIKESL